MRPHDGSFRNGVQVQGLRDGWGWEQCDQGTARKPEPSEARWRRVSNGPLRLRLRTSL